MTAGIGFSSTNYVTKASNGLGPRTVIASFSKSNMTQAELDAVIRYLGNAQGDKSGTDQNGPDAFTVAGVSSDGGDAGGTNKFVTGESDVVYLALQGTGTLTAGSNFGGVTGVTSAVVTTFDNNF